MNDTSRSSAGCACCVSPLCRGGAGDARGPQVWILGSLRASPRLRSPAPWAAVRGELPRQPGDGAEGGGELRAAFRCRRSWRRRRCRCPRTSWSRRPTPRRGSSRRVRLWVRSIRAGDGAMRSVAVVRSGLPMDERGPGAGLRPDRYPVRRVAGIHYQAPAGAAGRDRSGRPAGHDHHILPCGPGPLLGAARPPNGSRPDPLRALARARHLSSQPGRPLLAVIGPSRVAHALTARPID